jgi:TRAP-type C4-dicarboxylate transport system permease small subunit
MITTLRRWTERLAHALALAGFSGLLILSVMVVADITLRAVADYPLRGVNDVSAVVMVVVVAACIPNSLLLKQSIAIEVLGETLGGRIRAALDLFASLVVLGFFVLLTREFIPYAASVTASGEETWVLHWPVGPWWWTATVFFAVSVLAQVMVVIGEAQKLFAPKTTPKAEA